MHFEYAVEPKAMSLDWRTCQLLASLFGFDRGRLLSQFPKKWLPMAIKEAAHLPDAEKKKVVEKIILLKRRSSIKSGKPYDPELGWLENAIEQNEQQSFHAIIASKENANNSVVAIDELDDNQAPLQCSRDHRITSTAKEISTALAPLLRSAGTVLFIDPYFDIGNVKIRETLKCCLEEFATSSPQGLRCEVHFRDMGQMPSTEVIEREAKPWLVGVIPDGLSITFFSWKKKEHGAEFHDRFLLTEKGGVKLGAGFIAKGHHQTVNMSLLDTDFCENERANFKIDTTVYDIVGPVIEVFFDGRVVRI